MLPIVRWGILQNQHPIAYLSKALGPKSLGLSVYENELLAIILATQKWRAYLIHNQFIIRTDRHSLKYLLEHKISTHLQHKYLTKLLRYDYKIEYKKGAENKVADGLSRQFDEEGSCLAITTVHPLWIGELIFTYEGDSLAQETIAELINCPYNVSNFSYKDGLVRYHGKLYVGSSTQLRIQIIETMHASPLSGHSGIQGTFQRLQAIFYWPSMKERLKEFVMACQICQLCKHEHVETLGLLQPLPIPDQAWMHISIDFIEQPRTRIPLGLSLIGSLNMHTLYPYIILLLLLLLLISFLILSISFMVYLALLSQKGIAFSLANFGNNCSKF